MRADGDAAIRAAGGVMQLPTSERHRIAAERLSLRGGHSSHDSDLSDPSGTLIP